MRLLSGFKSFPFSNLTLFLTPMTDTTEQLARLDAALDRKMEDDE